MSSCGQSDSGTRASHGSAATAPRRILFITNIPSPYQVDFFTALSARPEVDIDVLFCAASEDDRQFSVPTEFPFRGTILESRRFPGTPKDCHYVPGFARVLNEHMPFDVAVLSGSYFMPAIHTARRFMLRRGIPWYYWGENPSKKPGSGWRSRLRETYLRRFLAPATGVLGVGRLACDNYRRLIPAGKPVHNLPYAPNLDPLLNPSEAVRESAALLRRAWPVSKPVVVLFSGSLTHRKAPDTLLAAFAEVASKRPELCLQIVGDGPMRGELETEVARRALGDRVRFLSFLEGPDLHVAYLSSDLFVLPTRTHEGWGVVVQEALAAGLPVLLSNQVGCLLDVATAGGAAQHFPPDNVPALSVLLNAAASRAGEPPRMNSVARDVARSLNCPALAEAAATLLGTFSFIKSTTLCSTTSSTLQ